MELSPHPHDIRVGSLNMNVTWKLLIPIVKDVLLDEVVIRDVRNWSYPTLEEFDEIREMMCNKG
jgi:hypothetical protein